MIVFLRSRPVRRPTFHLRRQYPRLYADMVIARREGRLTRKQIWVVAKAAAHACEIHAGQKRKSGDDYIVHPYSMVCKLVKLGVFNVVVLIGAWLHDGPEDQLHRILPGIDVDRDRAVARLTRRYGHYGSRVVLVLQILTRIKGQDKELYLRSVLMSRVWEALLIKLIDRWHNISTLEYLDPEHQKREAEMTQKIFPLIVEELLGGEGRAPEEYHWLIRELWREVQELCQSYLV